MIPQCLHANMNNISVYNSNNGHWHTKGGPKLVSMQHTYIISLTESHMEAGKVPSRMR